jgi:hypothetical protein
MEPFIAQRIRDQDYQDYPGAPHWLNIAAVWVLPQMRNWVYVAVLDLNDQQDSYDDVVALARASGAVLQVDASISMAMEEIVVIRVCGDEFVNCLQSLLSPPEPATVVDDFPVGNWISIARMGSHFGDINCIIAHHGGVIFIATIMRQSFQEYLEHPVWSPQVLRSPLVNLSYALTLRVEGMGEITIGEMECMQEPDSLCRIFMKSGLRVIAYYPWELRMLSANGSPLTINGLQENTFQKAGLPAHLIEFMPPTKEKFLEFSPSDRVRLCDGSGVVTSCAVINDETRVCWVYAEKHQIAFVIPESRLVREL